MAVVILFGLLSSTALNMLVVPALYLKLAGEENRMGIKESRQGMG